MRGRILQSVVWWVLLGAGIALPPAPYGPSVFLAAIAVYGAVFGIKFWRRTGLGFATAAVGFGVAFGAVASALIACRVGFIAHPLTYVGLLAPLLVGGLVCRIVEQRKHPIQWTALEASQRRRPWWDASFPDIPMLRVPVQEGRG